MLFPLNIFGDLKFECQNYIFRSIRTTFTSHVFVSFLFMFLGERRWRPLGPNIHTYVYTTYENLSNENNLLEFVCEVAMVQGSGPSTNMSNSKESQTLFFGKEDF